MLALLLLALLLGSFGMQATLNRSICARCKGVRASRVAIISGKYAFLQLVLVEFLEAGWLASWLARLFSMKTPWGV